MVRKSTSCITMDENVFILWITKNRSRYGCNDKDRFLDCQAFSGLCVKAEIPYRKLPFLAQFHTISTLRGRPLALHSGKNMTFVISIQAIQQCPPQPARPPAAFALTERRVPIYDGSVRSYQRATCLFQISMEF